MAARPPGAEALRGRRFIIRDNESEGRHVRFDHEFLMVDGPASKIRTYFAAPRGGERVPGLLLYSDIFQLTPSTLRAAARFAGYGFAVMVPEIYARRVPAGTAWAFDDDGRERGMAAAKATPVADFDADARSVIAALAAHPRVDPQRLGTVGFCIGGHLAFRAALAPEIRAAVCYYPTGLHNGALGLDADAGSLLQASETDMGRVHLVFGTEDQHVPAEARALILERLREGGVDPQVSTFPAEHAFMRDEGPRYDPVAADEAFFAGIATLRQLTAA